MTDRPGRTVSAVGSVTVRYWAAARAAAGVESDRSRSPRVRRWPTSWPPCARCTPTAPRLADVLAVCSVLVGDRPVGSRDPGDVTLAPGDTVELLPPFAGG